MIQEPPGGLPEALRGGYLAIDPGRDTGWALFADREHMVACGLGDPSELREICSLAATVAVEKPKIYNARNMKGDPNDIVTLAINAGGHVREWTRRGCKVVLVTPHEWKGTTPKDVDNARTIKGLSKQERAILRNTCTKVATSKQHNVVDAIGFGRACFEKHLWR